MKTRRSFRRALAAPLVLLALVFPATSAHALYHNGAFVGKMIGASGSGSFTLPAGSLFPQVTAGDLRLDAARTVYVFNGATMDFHISVGEFAEQMAPGRMRYTFFQLDAPGDARFFLVGTYTLTLGGDGNPRTVSGPVVGDNYGIYFAAKDTENTPADTADDSTFLVRVRALAVSADPINPTYLGRAQVLIGTRLVSKKTEAYTVTTTSLGTQVPLADRGIFGGSTFNQIVPADGSADVVLGADTPAVFVSNLLRTGTIGAGDRYTTSAHILRLAPGGPGTAGIGLGVTRFTRVVPGGKTLEGFIVFDVAAPLAGNSATKGYVFAFVTPQVTPALLFGTLAGTTTPGGSTATLTTELRAVDTTPPDALPGDSPDLYTDRYQVFETAATDLNGWRDLRLLQFGIDGSSVTGRVLARYDVATNRLALFNKALGRWTTGCPPGANVTLTTPWASLSCRRSKVYRSGEVLSVSWSIRPTTRMLGDWNAFLKVSDASGQAAGWRTVSDGRFTVKTHP